VHVEHAFQMLNRFQTILDVPARERESGAMGIEVRRLRCMRRVSNGCGCAAMRLRVPVDTGRGGRCSPCVANVGGR
jgi:hypothetical protein